MSKIILIDGAFKEETRVALVENNTLQSYDREDFNFKQLKGNIYLARITRIEPSLQAAFIDYGGERHGFLPFSDIHPDYYNIPKEEIKNLKTVKFFQNKDNPSELEKQKTEMENSEVNAAAIPAVVSESVIPAASANEGENKIADGSDEDSVQVIQNYSAEDEESDSSYSGYTEYSKYKIEDVIKEGQYVLVQVLKEERGNKGVAMTTYISIAGKYCVLMVNSPERGGVSKKVNNFNDRKILKSILRSLNVPKDKSLILRTAGVGKKPEEILKDYLYLIRLWNAIVESSLESKAPSFIHAEDDIIKKTIRDLYSDDVGEIIVEGNQVYKEVRALVKIIANNDNINVRLHNDKIPLFQRYNIENQLFELYNNKVNLPSGGSIVIDQTEALVSIDVNSGKATKEKNVEEMALVTNIEAANEIARQLKLRDLAGLVIIDFIDLFELKNRRAVEKAVRDAMSTDRARIQIARLSIFGLMELSRQRMSASFIERTSEICPRCKGRGKIKSREIVALSILRAIKYAAVDKQINVVTVETTSDLCTYLLNFKRKEITQIEKDYNIYVFIEENEDLEDNNYNIKKRKGLTPEEKKELDPQQKSGKVNLDFGDDEAYSVSSAEIKKYKFDEESYSNNNEKSNFKKVNKKQYNKYNKFNNYNNYNNNNNKSKENNWFKKLFGAK